MNGRQFGPMLLLAFVAGLIGGAASGQFFMGKSVFAEKKGKGASDKIVRAEGFVLVDEEGTPLASLLTSKPSNRPTLSMEHKDGGYFLEISPGLIMIRDKHRRPRLKLSLNELDYPSIKLRDGEGRLRVALGAASLIFFDPNERPTWSAP